MIATTVLYVCDKCQKTFRREAALKRHQEYDHQENDSSEEEENKQTTMYVHVNALPVNNQTKQTNREEITFWDFGILSAFLNR